MSTKIRLSSERFKHITQSHPEIKSKTKILNTINNPDTIIKGWRDELLAVKREKNKKRWFVVVYKQENTTGFVITAYVTTDTKWLFKRKTIWRKES